MFKIVKKIVNLCKKYWVEGLLVICLASAFMPAGFNKTIDFVAVGVLLGALVIKNLKKA